MPQPDFFSLTNKSGVSMSDLGEVGWRDARRGFEPFERPRPRRSLLDLATSVAPYIGLTALMFALLELGVSYVWILAIGVLAAGFLLRTFIVFHDCAHGNFLPWRRANVWVGTLVGLLVYTPYRAWQFDHAVHHASAGDLDRRGVGDVDTMTLAEYQASSRRKRLAYRAFRNPFVMFGVGPIWALLVQPRLVPAGVRPRSRRSILLTDVALVGMFAALCLTLGWQAFLLVWGPPVLLAGSVGVWLFYVQHQFEDTYWESKDRWSYADAALYGSSYLKLPQPLQFFTGNIGLHHVHHLSARIPNYNLQAAHDQNPIFDRVPVLSLWDGLKAVRLKVWDEASGRLLTWPEVRASQRSAYPVGPLVVKADT